jgi:hypothetical protein
VPRVCSNHQQKYCEANVLKACDYNNNKIDIVENCAANNKYCDSSTLTCIDRVCSVDGAKSCDGNILKTCHTASNSFSEEDCGENFCDPSAKACVARVWRDSEPAKCDKNTIKVCNESQNKYVIVEECNDRFCKAPNESNPTAFCEPRVCTVHGSKQCIANDIYVCNTANNTLSLDETCGAMKSCIDNGSAPACLPCCDLVPADVPAHIGCEFSAFNFQAMSNLTAKVILTNPDPAQSSHVIISSHRGNLDNPLTTLEYVIDPASTKVINIDSQLVSLSQSKSSLTADIAYIESSLPIAATLHLKSRALADETLLLPKRSLAKKYYAASRPNTLQPQGIVVIATEDDTTVSFESTTNLVAGDGLSLPSAGGTADFSLNKYQALNLVVPSKRDPSGSVITADKPVAVYSAIGRITLPSGIMFNDVTLEQVLPESYLGTEHIVLPQLIKRYMMYKETYLSIFAPEATEVTLSAPFNATISLAAGENYILENEQSYRNVSPLLITSTKPVSVSQFLLAARHPKYGIPSTDPANLVSKNVNKAAELSDPSHLYVLPTSQYTNKNLYFYAEEDWLVNYVMIIAPTSASVELYYNGEKHSDVVFPDYQVLGNYKFTFVEVDALTPGHFEASEPVGAFYYGYTETNISSAFRALGMKGN